MSARRTLTGVGAAAVATMLLAACSGGGGDPGGTIDGEATGSITVLTNRTDLVNDGTFEQYVSEFNETYPDVDVTVEGVNDYENAIRTRLNGTSYGDVLAIPAAVSPDQYSQFFEPLGDVSEYDQYRFTAPSAFEGTLYGIASGGNANGIVYNKQVLDEAGVTELPTTEAEWLEALQQIEDNTDATPFYTNYKDGWPVSQGMGNLGAITGDPDAPNEMAHDPEPWTEGSDIYSIDSLLYESVAAGLTEDDPLTTDWETSKTELGAGDIATMALGSWAISQIQAAAEEAGASADDIGYMAWPANVDGQQYAVIGGDYAYAISKHSDAKAAAYAWITWFAEESGYTESEGMVSTVVDAPLPDNLSAMEDAGVELMETNPAPDGEEGLLDEIADESRIDLYGSNYRQELIDVARGAADGDKASFFADLNERWGAAVADLAG